MKTTSFLRHLVLTIALGVLAVGVASAVTTVTTPNGTWTAYPGQTTSYQTSVQQPINTDGSSNFKANGHGVIPVKFALQQGTGPFVFESIFSNNPGVTSDDYSYLTWQSNTPFTLADLQTLSAVYAFTTGDCAGGSLRWTVGLNDNGTERNLDIHYQPGENGLSDQFCKDGTSGANMLESNDTIVVINQFTYTNSPYTFLSSYNTTYADALSQLGNLQVVWVALIVDSGWGAKGDQVVDLTSATIGFANTTSYTETFTPMPPSALTAVCPTEQASIQIEKTAGTGTGTVNEVESIQPFDDDGLFRIVDCKYMYNLATSSLSGVGTYKVTVVIDGVPAAGPAIFDLR